MILQEIEQKLYQGCKVEFKWLGSNILYVGRIEIDKYNRFYFINEHCFENDILKEKDEPMRFYNSLESFGEFTYFKIK